MVDKRLGELTGELSRLTLFVHVLQLFFQLSDKLAGIETVGRVIKSAFVLIFAHRGGVDVAADQVEMLVVIIGRIGINLFDADLMAPVFKFTVGANYDSLTLLLK